MKKEQNIIIGIALQCFMLTMIIYILLIETVASLIDPSSYTVLVSFIATVGVFSALFKMTLWIYDKYLFKYFFPSYDFDKEWNHITFIEGPIKDLRHGTVEFSVDFGNVSFSGHNYNAAREYRSSFTSKMTSLQEKNMLIQYSSFGAHRPDKKRDGVMWLIIEGKTPKSLKGYWSDVHPSEYHGSIIFFQNKEEFDEELKNEITRLKLEQK